MGLGADYKRTRSHTIRVRDMLMCDIPVYKIAKVLGIGENTVWRHYEDVIKDVGVTRGQRPFEPSDAHRNQVKMMSAVGITQADIASFLNISHNLLVQYFEEELRLGGVQANLQVGGNLFKMAMGDPNSKNTAIAAIWWSKARMGWKDVSRIENTGPDGGAQQHEHQVIIVLPDNGRGDNPALAGPDAQLIEHEEDQETNE